MTDKNENISTPSTDNISEQIWDEITKSIAGKMPAQFLPLFKEEFGKEYPDGTSVTTLSTESVTLPRNPNVRMSKILSDIVLVVGSQDLYHIECEVSLDNDMIIRMIEYDFHTALTHGMDIANGIHMTFPQSVIMYPGNASMPEYQQCTITFPDGFDYTYKVPIVKIQAYSLEDIASKKLLVFLPFTLMRFAPQVKENHDSLSEKELTDFIQQIIVMLDNEVNEGRLTVTQYKDYTRLLQYAAERVFRHTPKHQEEVYGMIKSRLILPSDEIEMKAEERAKQIAEQIAAQKTEQMERTLAEKDSALAEKDSLIQQLLEENKRLRQLQIQ